MKPELLRFCIICVVPSPVRGLERWADRCRHVTPSAVPSPATVDAVPVVAVASRHAVPALAAVASRHDAAPSQLPVAVPAVSSRITLLAGAAAATWVSVSCMDLYHLLSMDLYYLISMDLYGFVWTCMDFYGLVWTFMDL